MPAAGPAAPDFPRPASGRRYGRSPRGVRRHVAQPDARDGARRLNRYSHVGARGRSRPRGYARAPPQGSLRQAQVAVQLTRRVDMPVGLGKPDEPAGTGKPAPMTKIVNGGGDGVLVRWAGAALAAGRAPDRADIGIPASFHGIDVKERNAGKSRMARRQVFRGEPQ